MSTATFPSRWGKRMPHLVDRQVKMCHCGARIEIDTDINGHKAENHLGTCFPPRVETVVADNSNVQAPPPETKAPQGKKP